MVLGIPGREGIHGQIQGLHLIVAVLAIAFQIAAGEANHLQKMFPQILKLRQGFWGEVELTLRPGSLQGVEVAGMLCNALQIAGGLDDPGKHGGIRRREGILGELHHIVCQIPLEEVHGGEIPPDEGSRIFAVGGQILQGLFQHVPIGDEGPPDLFPGRIQGGGRGVQKERVDEDFPLELGSLAVLDDGGEELHEIVIQGQEDQCHDDVEEGMGVGDLELNIRAPLGDLSEVFDESGEEGQKGKDDDHADDVVQRMAPGGALGVGVPPGAGKKCRHRGANIVAEHEGDGGGEVEKPRAAQEHDNAHGGGAAVDQGRGDDAEENADEDVGGIVFKEAPDGGVFLHEGNALVEDGEP